MEGGDSYENLKLFFQEISKHRERTDQYKEDWSFAGDMLAGSHVLGLGGGFMANGHNCLHCHVHSNDLHLKTKATKRTRQSLWWCAHLPDPQQELSNRFPFQCPACGIVFLSQDQVDKEPTPTDAKKYKLEHWSTMHHRPPLLDIDPANVYVCSLHLLLSITKILFHCAIRVNVDSQPLADRINNLLTQKNIQFSTPVTPIRRKTTNIGRPLSFTGKECVNLLEGIDDFLDVVFQSDERKKIQHRIVFENFVLVFNRIRHHAPEEKDRLKQSNDVRVLAEEFYESFLRVFHESEIKYYIHSLLHHVPDQISQGPLRFFSCSGHGIEILNHELKRLTRFVCLNNNETLRTTNRKWLEPDLFASPPLP